MTGRTRRAPGHVPSLRTRAVGVALGAAAARGAYTGLRTRPPGGSARWERINHRGRTLTLLEGPAFAAGAATAVALTPGLPARVRAAGAVAILGAGAVGTYDDLCAGEQAKGLAGHLAALRAGRITGGAVKVAGIGAAGLAAAALIAGRPREALLGGAVIAGYANLANLLDLRPGRALKFGLLHAPLLALPGPAGRALAGPLGAAGALLPTDLRQHAMLGDAGANALGAALGTAVLLRYGARGRALHLAGLAALTLASERVSFTKVIAETPPLRWLDELGR